MMGVDLQPDGLTTGLAWYCQPDEKSVVSERIRSDLYACFKRNNVSIYMQIVRGAHSVAA